MSNETATDPRKSQIVGIPMTGQMRETIEQLAAPRRWSRAEAARYLIERGLEAEARDVEKAAA